MVGENYWNGFLRKDFEFEGMEAVIVFPEKANENKTWLLKTEYFGAFPSFEIEMLGRGWHLVYVKNITRWCLDEDIDRKARFAEFLNQEYGLYKKCIPVGMSCGGMIGVKFAAEYPELVSALYLDAPVMNLLSCPAGIGKATDSLFQEFKDATGMTISDLISYRNNPIDRMHVLQENNIPVIMVYGDSDDVVPYDENGELLEKMYRESEGIIEVYGKAGCGHHPHGLEDNTPIIRFCEKYCF